jgi:hypothetical protein
VSQPSAYLQRALPTPYRARALWRGCRWAVDVRPWLGRQQSGPGCCKDSRSRNLGRFRGGLGVPMISPQRGGQFVNSNAANTDLAWEDWQWQAIPQLGIYMWQDTGGMTLACYMKFRSALPATDVRILTKRFGTAANFHCAALSFSQAQGNKFEFSYCDGVTTQSIYSAIVPNSADAYVLVGRHWGNNANRRAELWVNGKREAVNAAPATFPAYKKDPPLVFFGDTASGNPVGNERAAMGGLWDRPLSTAEIQQLTVNPFVMWGPPAAPMGLPFASGSVLDGCKCGGPWLHAWSGLG